MMSRSLCRCLWAGLTLGLACQSAATAQEVPPVFPPLGSPAPLPNSRPMVEPSPIARPLPSVVEVPPEGVNPNWRPDPIDPVALERWHSPKHFFKKTQSWHWRRLQGKFFGYPEDFEPRPLGASVYEAGKIMTANGASAGLALYNYDFIDGTSELSPRGVDQLVKIAAQLSVSPYVMVVERTPSDPGLAESRRFAVLARLARSSCPVTSDRVLVGVPRPFGLSGTDAQVIAGNALGRVQQYGPPIPINANGVNSPSGVTSGSGGVGSLP